jgi:hypothetical protein
MKIIALFLCFCLSLNVLASTSTLELERSMDEYQFALAVEWDQHDQEFYQNQTELFMKKIGTLIKDHGLTKEELLLIAQKKVQDKEVLEAIQAKMTLLGAASGPQELSTMAQEISRSLYKKGASWNGGVSTTVLAGLLLVALVGYAIWFDANYDCVAWTEEWRCETKNYDTSASSRSVTTCGWREVCAQYEKKK